MPQLVVFVDYDNVERTLVAAGATAFAKLLVSQIPNVVLARHKTVHVRLYGGWRTGSFRTNQAQIIVANIQNGSGSNISIASSGVQQSMRLTLELADGPLGTSTSLERTYVKDRDLRTFRARPSGWKECGSPQACGLGKFIQVTNKTPCNAIGCGSSVGNVFVRDEQKMVDTLIVADIAFNVFFRKATDTVLVSSDTDMWPAIMLALRVGSNVTHIHPKPNGKTQSYLMATLNQSVRAKYMQLSI